MLKQFTESFEKLIDRPEVLSDVVNEKEAIGELIEQTPQ